MTKVRPHTVFILILSYLSSILTSCSVSKNISGSIGEASRGPQSPSFGIHGEVTTGILNVGNSTLHSIDKAQAIQVQSDGKILVAGNSDPASSDFALFRYNHDGTLDSSFNSTGKVMTDISSSSYDLVSAMALQSDGKIIVAGTTSRLGPSDFAIVRYNIDGSLDTTFNSTGIVTTNFGVGSYTTASAVGIQMDGKILVAGSTNASGNNDFALARYNSDGSLDTTFNSSGKITTDFSTSNDLAHALAIQNDGKIVLAGSTTAAGNPDFAVARYNSSGSLDTSFNSTGLMWTDIATSSTDEVSGMALQSDGKILVAGYAISLGNYDFAVIRLDTNGALDATFNTTGIVETDLGFSSIDQAFGIAVQADGKILLSGVSTVSGSADFASVRYDSNGALDTSFNASGMVTTDFGTASGDLAYAVTVQSDGKILVAGESNASGSIDFAVVRYSSAGTLDTTFNVNGKVLTDMAAASREDAFATALQPDGKLLVAGYSNAAGSDDFAVMRYEANGSLDLSFNGSGIVTTDLNAGSDDNANAIAVQSDGKILVAGTSISSGSDNIALTRYNRDGSLDTSFNTTGKVLIDLGPTSYDGANAVAVQTNGKIIVAGYTTAAGSYDFVVLRFNSDGSPDTSFNSTGQVITNFSGSSDDQAYSISVQSNGKILIAGYSDSAGTYDFAVARYNDDGTLDTSFNSTGLVTTDFNAGSDEQAFSMVLQDDGKIVLSGYSDSSFALVRYNPDGSLDTSLNTTGKVKVDFGPSTWSSANAVALQADGKIVAAGSTGYPGFSDFFVARFNPDGALDTSFNTGVVRGKVGTASYNTCNAVTVQSDGKIFVAGSSNPLGSSDFALVRFNSDGSK